MKLLTNGRVIVMATRDGVWTEPMPHAPHLVDSKMDWEHMYQDIIELHQVRRRFPNLFYRGSPDFVPNLHLVRVNEFAFQRAYADYFNTKPKCADFLYEISDNDSTKE